MSDLVEAEGSYDGIPDSEYHADKGSLSSSGARKLLPPSTPAQFRWEQDHPRESTDAFDLGHAVHTLVLGEGAEIAAIDAATWSTKAAKEAREQARAEGKVPLLAKDAEKARAMAASVKGHPLATHLFSRGVAERSIYWRDAETGVMLRARPDWLPERGSGRLVITDLKTSASSDPEEFSKSAAKYGYAIQHAWYCEGARAVGLDDDPAFVFVVVEKTAPYLVSVIELDQDAVAYGRRMMRRAIDIYAQCVERNDWPGHQDDIHLVSLPKWVFYQEESLSA